MDQPHTWVYTDTKEFLSKLQTLMEEKAEIDIKIEKLIGNYESDILSSMYNKFYK